MGISMYLHNNRPCSIIIRYIDTSTKFRYIEYSCSSTVGISFQNSFWSVETVSHFTCIYCIVAGNAHCLIYLKIYTYLKWKHLFKWKESCKTLIFSTGAESKFYPPDSSNVDKDQAIYRCPFIAAGLCVQDALNDKASLHFNLVSDD